MIEETRDATRIHRDRAKGERKRDVCHTEIEDRE